MKSLSFIFLFFISFAVFAHEREQDEATNTLLEEMLPFKIAESQPIWEGSANEKLRPTKQLVQSNFEIESLKKLIEAYSSKGLFKKAALTQNQLGLLHLNLAQNNTIENRSAHLYAAEKAFSKALEFFNPNSMPLDCAMVKKNLAITFQDQAQTLLPNDRYYPEALSKSITLYNSAIDIYKSNGDIRNTAITQMYLATALQDKSRSSNDKESMDSADMALGLYQQVLIAFEKNGYLREREVAMENYANMLVYKAKKTEEPSKSAMLKLAIDTYQLLLSKQERCKDSHDWAHIQANLGRALHDLANSSDNQVKKERLLESMVAFYSSLIIYTPDALPQHHSRIQVGLGFTLFGLSQVETLPQDKKDWFFIEALLNIVEGTTALADDPNLFNDGQNLIKQLHETREHHESASKSLL